MSWSVNAGSLHLRAGGNVGSTPTLDTKGHYPFCPTSLTFYPESPHLLVGIFWPLVAGCRERFLLQLEPLRIFFVQSDEEF